MTAAALLLVLELVLRALNPQGLIAASGDREVSYRGLVTELGAYGAPDVAIVGSSRARRGVSAPLLKKVAQKRERRLRVGNFSLSGAMAEEVELAVRRLSEVSPPPRVIVWPISPREFEIRGHRPAPHARYLWRVKDWWTARTELGGRADALLPEAIRNELSGYSLLVRYRFVMRDLLERPPRRRVGRALSRIFSGWRGPTPLHGDIDPIHEGPKRNISKDVPPERVRRYIGDAYREPNWPRNYQAAHFESAIATAKEAGIAVIVVELPSHPLMEGLMPANTSAKLRAYLRDAAERHGVRFIPADELGVAFEKADFREQSHMNLRGSSKFTKAIGRSVVRALDAR